MRDFSDTTDEIEALAPTSPLDDLQSVAPLILDLEKRDSVLARYEGSKRLVAEEILQAVGQLMQVTEWREERLLSNLGCHVRTVADLSAVTIESLERSRSFLRFLSRLTGLVDLVSDRRTVLIECAGLLKSTGRDADGLMSLFETGPFTPIDYIRLGEVAAAADLARRIAGRRATSPLPLASGPFDDAPLVHLSTVRIEAYLTGSRGVLGGEVFQRIEAHLEECDGCSEAVEDCRAEALRNKRDVVS